MIITNLAVNHIANLLGYDLGAKPTFSWIVEESAGTRAVASRVVVTCDDMVVTDTGWADLDAKACALLASSSDSRSFGYPTLPSWTPRAIPSPGTGRRAITRYSGLSRL